jgi:hypothetical protein
MGPGLRRDDELCVTRSRAQHRHCERSEAIHGAANAVSEEWIASSQGLLAMTTRHTFAASPNAFFASYSFISRPPNRGRRECRALDAPDSRVCHVEQERTRVSRVHRNHPAFPTQWFTDYTCAPRCSGFLATVTPEKLSLPRNLTPASRRQDYTTSPSARKRPRLKAPLASTASCPASVTLANAPPMGQDGCEYSADLQFGKPEYFFAMGWTRRPNQCMRRKVICPSGASVVPAKAGDP